MFVVVRERALAGVEVIGPFEHKEDAESYMDKKHHFPDIWRVAELTKPEAEGK